jgi:cell division protein FtsB
MTAVGKILIFLNLVFSLAVGGFAVASYTARTHWAEGFDKLKSNYETVKSANDNYSREIAQLSKEKAELYEQFKAEWVKISPDKEDQNPGATVARRVLETLTDNKKRLKGLSDANDSLKQQLAEAKSKNGQLQTNETAYKENISRYQTDMGTLRTSLADEFNKNARLNKEYNEMRTDLVTAQIQARTFKDRNSQLETQLREMTLALGDAKRIAATGGRAAAKVPPPPENVEGLVKKVREGLVEISLGSDAGIAKGQTLEVFRLGANPLFIGKIQIIEVTNNLAVGQKMGTHRHAIQVNDRVASSILGGN